MGGPGQHGLRLALFDDVAIEHDGDVATERAGQPHVVRDAQHGHAASLRGAQHGQDVGAPLAIESLARFVDDQQARAGRVGGQESHALRHAARNLVRIQRRCMRHVQLRQVAQGCRSRLFFWQACHQRMGFGHLLPHAHGGVERQPRFLRQQRHFASPQRLPCLLVRRIVTVAADAHAAFGAQACGQGAHDGVRQQGLARAALAQQGQRAAGGQAQAGALEQRRAAFPVDDSQSGRFQPGVPVHARSPLRPASISPSMVKNSSATGAPTSHGASL